MAAKELIESKISENDVFLFGKSYCPHCKRAFAILKEAFGDIVKELNIEDRSDCAEIQDELLKMTGGRSVPRVFIKGKFVGGCDDTVSLAKQGKLKALLA
eukprot:CAMPEP_0177769288 /NCGR_PEP_ID=MMETSP0491_2-20121128/10230_1 /TAXON_ID=63592 /ORGANISM="Tetraselmis chuii, Strain PLY429" /LENGTH=99 /DNA_ID=CAMNT_0019286263 /DNA_START=147 /DNA_END=446 /DNA_ORIENTATION=-